VSANHIYNDGRYGQLLVSKYQDYKHAERDINEIILNIKGSWLKTEIQLETMRNIWHTLDGRLQVHFTQVLQHLQGKLQAALVKLDGIMGSRHDDVSTVGREIKIGQMKRWKTMLFKASIEEAIQDLNDWQIRFDPSWYLITRIADPVIDKHLESKTTCKGDPIERLREIREAVRTPSKALSTKGSVFVDSGLIDRESQRIPWSKAYKSHYANHGAVILDTTTYPPGAVMSIATIHVRDLARLLSKVDPSTFSLLCCHGVTKIVDENGTVLQFQFIFGIPPSLRNPRALRDLLLTSGRQPLEEAFQLAKQLARSVMFVHTAGFVHKNIRPETILVFQDEKSVLGPSFLVGFERFRPEAAGTNFQDDSSWETNLYRHPRRQGVCPEDIHIMQHDIYSLGVCLLEVGLWGSFVCPDGANRKPGPELEIADAMTLKDKVKAAFSIKRILVEMAKSRLPSRMGTKYTSLVVSCLTCLDPDETNHFMDGADLQDEDGVVVGVLYIEKVT
jgi:hypothetical protein